MTAARLAPTLRPAGAIDVVSIGETMAVLTPVADISLEHAEVCYLSVGGAESNVLTLLARSRLRTRFVTRVGDDPLGRRVLNAIRDAGVDVPETSIDPRHPTGVYFKERGGRGTTVSYYRAGSAASTLDIDALAGAQLQESRALYLTGITPALSPTLAGVTEAALDAASDHGTTVLFDVNYRPLLWPTDLAARCLLQIALRADVVFVGLDEARALWNTTTAHDVRMLFGPWPGHLVVKDGAVGATEFHHGKVEFVPAEQVNVVEEVGAGDAFAAGYTAALFASAPSDERLRRGHRQAALALQSVGDVPDGVAS